MTSAWLRRSSSLVNSLSAISPAAMIGLAAASPKIVPRIPMVTAP